MIDRILSWCKGQTYSIQLVCNRLYAWYKKVQQEEFFAVLRELLAEEQAVFHNYKNLLTKKQWQLLIAIASDEPVKHPTAGEFIQKHGLVSASSVRTALQF